MAYKYYTPEKSKGMTKKEWEDYVRESRVANPGTGQNEEIRSLSFKNRQEKELLSQRKQLDLEHLQSLEKSTGRNYTSKQQLKLKKLLPPSTNNILDEKGKRVIETPMPQYQGMQYILVEEMVQVLRKYEKSREWVGDKLKTIKGGEAWETVERRYKIYRRGALKASFVFDDLAGAIQAFGDLEMHGKVLDRQQLHGQRIGVWGERYENTRSLWWIG